MLERYQASAWRNWLPEIGVTGDGSANVEDDLSSHKLLLSGLTPITPLMLLVGAGKSSHAVCGTLSIPTLTDIATILLPNGSDSKMARR